MAKKLWYSYRWLLCWLFYLIVKSARENTKIEGSLNKGPSIVYSLDFVQLPKQCKYMEMGDRDWLFKRRLRDFLWCSKNRCSYQAPKKKMDEIGKISYFLLLRAFTLWVPTSVRISSRLDRLSRSFTWLMEYLFIHLFVNNQT